MPRSGARCVKDKFRAKVSRYLSNAQYTGFSDKAWYLPAAAALRPPYKTPRDTKAGTGPLFLV